MNFHQEQARAWREALDAARKLHDSGFSALAQAIRAQL